MPQLLRSRRSYDHRIREIVCQTRNPRIFQHLRIPRSTIASWLSRGRRSVVSLNWHHDIASVLDENERLKRRTERQTAIIRLLVMLPTLSSNATHPRRGEHHQGDGHRYRVSSHASSNSGRVCPKNREGLCVGNDLVQTRTAAWLAKTASPCVSRKAKDRHSGEAPQRVLAYRRDRHPTCR